MAVSGYPTEAIPQSRLVVHAWLTTGTGKRLKNGHPIATFAQQCLISQLDVALSKCCLWSEQLFGRTRVR